MRTRQVIHVVNCHAEGEVGDVIVGGVMPPPGKTLWEQSRFIANDENLRKFVLNEPRGGIFRHVNLLVPAKAPDAQMGFIIMEPADTPPMSGSNSICVSTVLLDTGIVPMTEPITRLKLEVPMGVIDIEAHCDNHKAERIFVRNIASFVDQLDARLYIKDFGELRVDTAFGGDSFVVVTARDIGISIRPENASKLAEIGVKITEAANQQLGFKHPQHDWSHISFCAITEPVSKQDNILTGKSAVVIKPGKIDRSPTGTFCSARMAILHARGEMRVGDKFFGHSIIDTEFQCHIDGETQIGSHKAIIPVISGRAWITGISQLMLDPADPFPLGYRLSDTWPNL